MAKRGRKSQYDWVKAEELYNQGLTDGLIAKQLEPKCTHKTVCLWRYVNDLPSNEGILPKNYPKHTKQGTVDYGKFRQLYDQGMVDREIAKQVGCSIFPVFKWRKINGLHGNQRKFNLDKSEVWG